MKKINVITLGCSKNTVDSEHLAAQLADAGYEIVFDSDRTRSDVVVINTCGFIGDAKKESIDTILAAAAAKQQGLVGELFVIGCLSERYADELRAELPEVDDFFGVKNWGADRRASGRPPPPRIGDPSHALHPVALRLSENSRGLRPHVRLLRHTAHPRPLRLAPHRGARRGGDGTGRERREGADRHSAGHDMLRHRPLRPPCVGRAARTPMPHRQDQAHTPALRLPYRLYRRADRHYGTREEDMPLYRPAVPAHIRFAARGHEAQPHLGRGLRAGRPSQGAHPRHRAAHHAHGRVPGRERGRLRGADAVRQPRALRASGRLRLLRGGGHLLGPAPEKTTCPKMSSRSASTASCVCRSAYRSKATPPA